jgi:c-di-GMP-binding flagellar brake protein YcgR
MEQILKFADHVPTGTRRRVRNRRVTIRYACAPATAGAICVSDSAANDQEFQRAWIDNLSKGGVGMYLNKSVPIGSIVLVQIKSQGSEKMHELSGQVMHVHRKDPYGWYVGVEFLQPIADAELDAIL